MRLPKFLAITIAIASLIFIVAAPSYAQQGKTTQNVRSTATPPLSLNKPYVRPVVPNARDHRKAANPTPTVKPSEKKRGSRSGCASPSVGGRCLGFNQDFFRSKEDIKAEKKRTGEYRVLDHRYKSSDGGPVKAGSYYTPSSSTPPPARKRSPD